MSLISILILTAGGLLCLYGLWDRRINRAIRRAEIRVDDRKFPARRPQDGRR